MSYDIHRKCSKCGATPYLDKAVRLHRFPKLGISNVLKLKIWAMYCWPEKDWTLESLQNLYKRHLMLCGKHFQECFFIDSSKKRLFQNAVPGTKEFVTKTLKLLENSGLASHIQVPTIPEAVPGPSGIMSHREKIDKAVMEKVPIIPEAVPGPSGIMSHGEKIEKAVMEKVPTIPEAVPGPSGIMSHREKIDKVVMEKVPTIPEAVPGPSDIMSHREKIDKAIMEKVPTIPEAVPGPSGIMSHGEKTDEAVMEKRTLKSINKKKGILRPISVRNMEELTPREKKIYLVARKSLQEIARLRKRLKNRPKRLQIGKICEDDNVKKFLNLKLSPTFALLLQSEMQNNPKKLRGRRYNLDQKIMALTLYKKSPTCYRLLRRMFTLPSQSTLTKLLNRVPLETGINKQIFSALKTMAEEQYKEDNICSLLFDEMAIRKHLSYNNKANYIEGYQDHGDQGRTQEIASNALVFMLTGIRKKWKQPVAFYFSGKSVTSDRLAVLIKQVLDECCAVGLNVVATICDLSRVNIKALESLGAKSETPYFLHNNREIVTILDPPHLLKCLRNLLIKYNIECPSDVLVDGKNIKGTAKWKHIKDFYEKDKNNPFFVFAPALTDAHIDPNTKQKMRVKLAAQVFSHTVAAGILSRIALNELPSEANATVNLIAKFDKLFDALNADTPDLRRGKPCATNYTQRSQHNELFDEMIIFIKNMQYINCKSLPPSHMGWIRTINAVKRLWKNLNKIEIHSLSTRRLNQDPLENLFGCIRYNCGSNVNPTVGQFVAGMKTAIISNLRNNSRSKNCEDDSAKLYCNLKNFLLPANYNIMAIDDDIEGQGGVNNFERLLSDATEAVEQASAEAQACAYVCGFIVKNMISNCSNCQKDFLCTDIEPIHIFTNFKEYNTMHNSLKYVNKHFVQCVEFSSAILNNFFKKEGFKKQFKEGCIAALQALDFNFINCVAHKERNIKFIKNSLIEICVKRFTVLENRKFISEEKKKPLYKN